MNALTIGSGGAVFRRDGSPMTTSKAIAEHFDKRHKNVLRDIDRLISEDAELRLSFEPELLPVKAGLGGTRLVRGYAINPRGFALLTMGFTGAKALQWKLKFLEAFDHLAERENDTHRKFLRGMRKGYIR